MSKYLRRLFRRNTTEAAAGLQPIAHWCYLPVHSEHGYMLTWFFSDGLSRVRVGRPYDLGFDSWFLSRVSTTKRYWYSNSIRPSVRLSVRLSRSGVVSKRLRVSSYSPSIHPCLFLRKVKSEIWNIQGGQKNGASVFHCKYFENSTTELRGSWWTSAVLYVERNNYLFV